MVCIQDLLVMYRQTQPSASKLVKLRQRIIGPNEQESTPKYQQRNNINMRIYRDIPVPSWKIVFPNKLLQFRPLDGLRSDLVSIAGLLCECSVTCFMKNKSASPVKCSLSVPVPSTLSVCGRRIAFLFCFHIILFCPQHPPCIDASVELCCMPV